MQDNRNYGSIVNGILSVPFYLFFGPSSASLKMVSILFSVGVLVFWYLLLNRFFNQRVAIITSLLFTLSPTVYTKCSVLSVGSHPETNLFTSIIIFILYLIFFDNRKDNKYFILLGLISGFSFFYSYLFGITLLVLLIFWFMFDKKFILRPKFWLFLIFFLIGLSPRVYFAEGVKPAFEGVSFFLRDAFRNDISFIHIMLKTKAFLLKDLPRLFAFEHMSNFFQYIYYIFFMISFFSLLWFDRHLIHGLISLKLKKVIISNKSLFLIFPLIFSLAYILSGYDLEQKGWQFAGYIVPLYPFIFATIGISFDKVFRKNKFPKTLSVIVLSLFLMVGLYENLALISFSKIGQGFTYAGYSYRFFGERIGTYRNFNNNRILEMIRTIAFQKRKYFLEGLGWSIARAKGEEDILNEEMLDDDSMKRFYFSDQERLHYYKGLGKGVAYSILRHLEDQKGILRDYTIFEPDLTILKSVIEKKDVKTSRYFWEGFGQEVNLSYDVYQMIIKKYLEDQFKPYLYRGVGESIAWLHYGADFLYSEIPAKYREDFHSSYRETRSRMLLKDYR
ncbi:ArnT family glycosyltransferase [Candidatus Omnitrophota bacterium]